MNRELAAASPDLVGNDDLLCAILGGCGDCIKILDLEGRLQFMSEGGKRVMEVEDFGKLKGCPWPDFWQGEGNRDAVAAIAAAKSGKSARFRGPAGTAKGTAKHWDVHVSPIFDDAGRVTQILSISKDITEEWQAAERVRFLAAELQHRAKNSFAMVLAIATQTFREKAHAASLRAFKSRVAALAKAHEIAENDVPISEIAGIALEPYQTSTGRFSITGPQVMLNPRQALSLTLALNELATNATKYGALSVPSGKVEIAWSRSADTLRFAWQERDGPAAVEPAQTGFGTRVIRDFLASDFGGEVRLRFEPDGLVCELSAPAANLPS